MSELFEKGKAAWPDIDLAETDFLRPGDEPEAIAHPEDLYLARACAIGVPAALAIFERHVLPEVIGALRKLDSSPSFADEVQQLLRRKLLVGEDGEPPRIASYAGRGPLPTWVRVSAVRTGLNLRAKGHREIPMEADRVAAVAPLADDPALDYLKKRYAAEFAGAFRSACGRLTNRQRTVLRLNFADGLNIAQIGDVYGVHRATVARWIARAREQLFEYTREDLANTLKLSTSEFDSLVRMVRSQIDISMSKFFAATSSE